ncbi:hypothetical protein D5F01_LYC23843 [Larimichthys crocea]|uniref:Uncharacterized protein n=1 Tax=Larimichthys crocea TaxID=215358 RepID=A0A6G0HGB9_LARCR|nr:hypothetical protein D5F01_LYC23843 [Larimichthys crocea]
MSKKFKRIIRLDHFTLNSPGNKKSPPSLVLPNHIVFLDWPRQDFDTGWNRGTAGYFCSNWEYGRDPDLSTPGPSVSGETVRREVILDGMQLQKYMPYNPATTKYQPVPRCPENLMWILNTAYIETKGKLFKLRWGPNYVEPLQGMYFDLWLGSGKIWTNSPEMYRQLARKEGDPGSVVVENQHEHVRVTSRMDISAGRPLIDSHKYSWQQQQALRHDMRARLTNLTIESPTQRYHPKQPLYTMLTQARGDGEHFWEAHNSLVTGGYREGRTPAEGPLPKPEQVLVACWKWAWKGLDPEIRYKSPVYKALLRQRTTRSSSGGIKGSPPIVVQLDTVQRKPRKNKNKKRRPVWSYSLRDGWICRYCTPRPGGGGQD